MNTWLGTLVSFGIAAFYLPGFVRRFSHSAAERLMVVSKSSTGGLAAALAGSGFVAVVGGTSLLTGAGAVVAGAAPGKGKGKEVPGTLPCVDGLRPNFGC